MDVPVEAHEHFGFIELDCAYRDAESERQLRKIELRQPD